MMPPLQPPNPQFKYLGLLGLGSFWAFLTGIFFDLPNSTAWVGCSGIAIALAYSGIVCLVGRPAIGFGLSLITVLTLAYVWSSGTSFSVINYAVWMVISVNIVIFGQLGITLRKTMSVWKSWLITAGSFAGSLSLGWLLSLMLP